MMEDELLVGPIQRRHKRKGGGKKKWIPKIFRRTKCRKQLQQRSGKTLVDLPSYFANHKDHQQLVGADSTTASGTDTTTYNLSTTDSNRSPNLNGSFDSVKMARPRRGTPVPQLRNEVAKPGDNDKVETFAQLDVPRMLEPDEHNSNNLVVFSDYRSFPTEPVDGNDHGLGTEIVLCRKPTNQSQSPERNHSADEVNTKDDIFMSFINPESWKHSAFEVLEKSRSLTWVSADATVSPVDIRPVKEILVPTSSFDRSNTGSRKDGSSSRKDGGSSRHGSEQLSRKGSVRDAIFASLEKEEAPPPTTMVHIPPRKQQKPSILKKRSQSAPDANSVQNSALSGSVRKTPLPLSVQRSVSTKRSLSTNNSSKQSTAFLKRKSVFTGQDLLTQEADNFAEFLEDISESSFSAPLFPNDEFPSAEDRLLSALHAMDVSDDDISSLSKPKVEVPYSSMARSVQSDGEPSKFSEVSSTIFSKSMSSYDFGDVHSASFIDSYAPSYQSLVSKNANTNKPTGLENMCGGFLPFVGEQDDDTLSHDYSSKASKQPFITQVRSDLMDAFQDMAGQATLLMKKKR